MRYLVTGGAGFIGSHLTERLLTDGHSVTILDDLSSGSLRNLDAVLDHPQMQFVHGDILDSKRVSELAERCDTIVHLAAAVGVRRILADPLGGMRINVAGTESVLEAAHHAGCKVLVASTSEVYGKCDLPQLCETADSVFGPATFSRWSYATSKKLDEYWALGYHQKYGLPVVVVRLFNVVGPRQTSAYGSVLPNFVRAAVTGRPIQVYGDGLQRRNFTAVWDCVDAFLQLLATPAAVGEVFNIGSGNQTTIFELAETVKRLTGSQSPIEIVSYADAYPEGGFEDMRSRTPCICKIRSYTEWLPKVHLEEVILASAKQFASGRPQPPADATVRARSYAA
jgi:nucleoside-diphosphate-sugar epimerase